MFLNALPVNKIVYALLLLLPSIGWAQSDSTLVEQMPPSESVSEPVVAVLPTFQDAVNELNVRSLSKLAQAIETLAQIDHPRTLPVMKALLQGQLYTERETGQVLVGSEQNDRVQIYQAVDGKNLGFVDLSAVKAIKLSNRLRSQLRSQIAQLQLDSKDAVVRLEAVKEIGKDPDAESIRLLKEFSEKEQDADIQDELELIFALDDLEKDNLSLRQQAVRTLMDKTSLVALTKLQKINEKNSEGRFVEPDVQLRKLARSAQVKMESRLHFYEMIETVFFGLSLGAVLVLAAIGLAITFGVMGVINMAHGELMMLGAYTTYVIQQIMPNHLALSLLLSVPAAFMISGLVGIGIERGIIRFLYGRPLETLLATFGVSLFLQQTVRSIFSPLNRSVSTPDFMSGSWHINDFLSLTWNRFYILVFCLIVFTLLLQILRQTRLGLEVRAVSQNRSMAKAMGIPTAWVDAMTFGLGSGIGGVAGVALSQITNVGPNLGQAYIVDSFMVLVFGGVGNLWGTLVGGFSLGIANKFLEPYAGAVLAKILVLVFIILFIQKRPRGLFPQKGRAAEA